MIFKTTKITPRLNGANGGQVSISIDFDLMDGAVVVASTNVTINIESGSTATNLKSLIAQSSKTALQQFYTTWKKEQQILTLADTTALDTFINNNINF